jgi:hypothetical protein
MTFGFRDRVTFRTTSVPFSNRRRNAPRPQYDRRSADTINLAARRDVLVGVESTLDNPRARRQLMLNLNRADAQFLSLFTLKDRQCFSATRRRPGSGAVAATGVGADTSPGGSVAGGWPAKVVCTVEVLIVMADFLPFAAAIFRT